MSGVLHIVATPIGNLEDITIRAVRILKEVSRIACEDTRHTKHLLDRYGIDKPLVSYHEHNERERTLQILEWLRSGEDLALVSDAGTPLISDPGFRLVEAAVLEGLRVTPVPGPAAFLAALSASGLPTDAFYYGGFLPPKGSARRRTLDAVSELDCVLIFYEAPHRLEESLEVMTEVFRDRTVVVARELTKIHEEMVRGTPSALLDEFRSRGTVKGEITIVIGKPAPVVKGADSIRTVFQQHLESGLSRMDAMKATARDCGMPKRAVYAELEKDE